MAATSDKKYVFEVAPSAGKIKIKNAVEKIFGVKVAKVNTINYNGRDQAHGRRPSRTSVRAGRKAYVQLAEDSQDHRVLRGYGVREGSVENVY